MKHAKKILCLIMAAGVFLSAMGISFPLNVTALTVSQPVNTEEKVYCKATLEDNFADDRILVVLKNDISLEFNNYIASDFKEVGCKNVENLSIGFESKVRAAITRKLSRLAENAEPFTAKDEETISHYNQILCLELNTKSKQNVLDMIKVLEKRNNVLYAGPDYMSTLSTTTPNDAYYNEQWSISKISLDDAWEVATCTQPVTVGIINTGIDSSHPDFNNKINNNLCCDFSGNAIEPTGAPVDLLGQGTTIAGIIGACANNNIGIAGTCWTAQMVSLRTVRDDGIMFSSWTTRAIGYSESMGIPLLNIGLLWHQDDLLYYDVVISTAVENYSGLVVCSAGTLYRTIQEDEEANNDIYHYYPANLPHSNVLTVAASNANDGRWIETYYSSHYGNTKVDLFAPGVDIITCYPMSLEDKSGYVSAKGTPSAAAYATGVAAMIMSAHPELSPTQVKSAIMSGTDSVSALNGLCVTGGRLNAYKAFIHPSIHSYTHTSNGVSSGHTCTCTECGCTFIESHTWIIGAFANTCSDCGQSFQGFIERP